MTRDQVSTSLRYMEHIRELSYEAESEREKRRLIAEYDTYWKVIEPYVTGKRPYTDGQSVGK